MDYFLSAECAINLRETLRGREKIFAHAKRMKVSKKSQHKFERRSQKIHKPWIKTYIYN